MRIRRMMTVIGLALLATTISGGVAHAHDRLVVASPAAGAALSAAPTRVVLTFDKPVQLDFDEVEVIGPGHTYWTAAPPTVVGDTVTAPLRALGPAGRYTIDYRITSADGHPVSGQTSFTLTKAGGGTPASGPVGTLSAQVSTPTGSGMPLWPWLVAAGCAVLLGLALARRLAR